MTLSLKIALGYVGIASVFGFLLCGYDKLMAKKNGWRIPEVRLVLVGLLGGGLGMTAGIYLFRHKTKHPLIYIPCIYGAVISVAILLWIWAMRF